MGAKLIGAFVVTLALAGCGGESERSPECQAAVDYGSVPENDQGAAWDAMWESC